MTPTIEPVDAVLEFVRAVVVGDPSGPVRGLPTRVVPLVPATAIYVLLKVPPPEVVAPLTVNSDPGTKPEEVVVVKVANPVEVLKLAAEIEYEVIAVTVSAGEDGDCEPVVVKPVKLVVP